MIRQPRVLVFAGTAEEAARWRREHGYMSQEALYVHSAFALRGMITGDLNRVFIGTFYERRDAADLREALLLTDRRRLTR